MTKLSSLYCLLGFSCNNDCLFCSTGGNRKVDTSTSDAHEFIEKHLSYGEKILFTGGEPSIRKDIVYLSNLAYENFNARVSMLTNARRFSDQEFTRKMVDSGLFSVTVSLYSHKESLNDYLTCKKGSLRETVKGIKNLEEFGVKTQVRTLITLPTFTSIPNIIEFITSKFNDVEVGICAMDIVENALHNKDIMVPRLSKTTSYIEEAIDLSKNRGLNCFVYEFPMCLLRPPYRDSVVTRQTMHNTVKYRSPKQIHLDRDQSYSIGSHTKCSLCSLRYVCPGTWQSYISLFGDQELEPQ